MNVRLVPSFSKNPASNALDDAKKDSMLRTLRTLVGETCKLRNEGVQYAKLAHSQGYADGYMRLLMDAGFLSSKELLQIVTEVRRGVDGPSTRIIEPAPLSSTPAALVG